MTGGSRIVAIDAGTAGPASSPQDIVEADTISRGDSAGYQETAEEAWEEPAQPMRGSWLAWAVAALAIAGWSGFYLWANIASLSAGVTPQQGAALVSSWSLPVVLVLVTWLIAMRSSRREAARFGDAARLLADEAARLETRLTIANRELSLAREFLGSQSRDLESLGRVASERISEHAARLQTLIVQNGAQVESIATVSTTALENMEKLRSQLPVMAASAKDVANNIGTAGRTAHSQLSDMVDGMNRLNEFGEATERQVHSVRERVDESLERLTAKLDLLQSQADERLALMANNAAALRSTIEANESESMALLRSRGESLLAELGASRQLLDEQEAAAINSLRARLGSLRDESLSLARALRDGEASALANLEVQRNTLETSVRETLQKLDVLDQKAIEAARGRIKALTDEAGTFDERLAQRSRQFHDEAQRRDAEAAVHHQEVVDRLDALFAELDSKVADRSKTRAAELARIDAASTALLARIETAGAGIAAIAAEASVSQTTLEASLDLLSARITESRDTLKGTGSAIDRLTDDSVRLLELLQASADQGREQLPAAIEKSVATLADVEVRVAELGRAIEQAALRGDGVAQSVADTRNSITRSLADIGELQAGLNEGATQHLGTLGTLRDALTSLDAETVRLGQFSRDELTASLDTLRHAIAEAANALEIAGGEKVQALAERLGEESAAAVDRVMRVRMAEAVGALEEAAGHAAGISRESAVNLRDQLAKIDELTGNLERRIDHARQRAEEQVDNDFARRMALINESLNSNAIDIAKALSSEVTDTAWAAYLRGDRGIFTRRAVRLLENQEARSIATIYGEDREFREHVSRYIHDFEAMLRQLLSTRDGHALSVTLLSSDMGKLYVALAQAIERLRD